MNKQYLKRFMPTLILALVFTIFLGFSQTTHAQGGNAGVGIIPATTDPKEQFEPGQVTQLSIKVSNLSDADQLFYLSKRNIVGVKDGGVPMFAEPSSEINGFEISDWITLDKEEIFVKAGEQTDVPFLITVPTVVTPGSHFGSIIISAEPPKLRESGASIGYEVAHLIHLRIAGEALESARIRQFSTSKYIYGQTKVDFNVVIENEGNTYVKPTGPLEIKNMFGKRAAMLNFNESQAGVLPKMPGSNYDSNGTRSFDITWEDEDPGFGRYEALLSVVYGDEGRISTISSTVTFWILPMNIITPALIILAVLCLIIFVTVKVYVKRKMAIATSGSTRRLVRSRSQGEFPVLLIFISMLALSAVFFIILLLLFA